MSFFNSSLSYVFFCVYTISVLLLATISNFFIFWLFLEFSMLSFIGYSFSVLTCSFTELMVFFIIQTVSSLSIMVSYLSSSDLFLLIFVLINLGLFPFLNWFVYCMVKMPNSVFFISSTLHKLPTFLLFSYFVNSSYLAFLLFSVQATVWICSLSMVSLFDFRLLLIFSSIANSGWMLLASLCSMSTFLVFFLFYTLAFFSIMSGFSKLSRLSFTSLNGSSRLIWLIFCSVCISGFPPSPNFLAKLFILYEFLVVLDGSSFYVLTLLVGSAPLLLSYFRFLSLFLTNTYSSTHSFHLGR